MKGLGGTFHFPFLKVSISEMGVPVSWYMPVERLVYTLATRTR